MTLQLSGLSPGAFRSHSEPPPADPAEPLPVEVSKVYSLAGPNNHGAMPSRKKGSNKSNKSNK